MQQYRLILYIKLLIQGRGIPLHELSQRSGLSQDDLLDVLSERRPAYPDEIGILLKVLKANSVIFPATKDALPVSTKVQLDELKNLDERLLENISNLVATTNEAEKGSSTKSIDAFVDRQELLDNLTNLADLYEAYHQELSALLNEYPVKDDEAT